MSSTPHMALDHEPAETIPRNFAIGSKLVASAVAIFFMSFVFGFLYLRALNTAHSFREPHVTPPIGWGVAILACVLVSCLALEAGRRTLGDGTSPTWRLLGFVSWFIALAAVALQGIEYYNLHFGATDGGLASVFFGFTMWFAVFWLGSVYWVETIWAQSIRRPASSNPEVGDPARLLRPGADSALTYMYMMAATEVVAFVLLYLVK
jgi:heme/copper-type cytochrome/quinol oxidase subunit 3